MAGLQHPNIVQVFDLGRTGDAQHSLFIAMEYVEGLEGIPLLRHGGRSIRAAALLYREILRQIERDGLGVRRPHRPVVGRAKKAQLLIAALASRA